MEFYTVTLPISASGMPPCGEIIRLDGNFGVFLNHPDAKMPTKAYSSDAGFDISSIEDVSILPNDRKIVRTGIHLQMHDGWEAQVRARSGNAAKFGLMVVNGIGTIDCAYVGEIKVILYNSSKESINLPKYSKVAQLVFQRVPIISLYKLNEIPTNETRGENGFGSSGQSSNI